MEKINSDRGFTSIIGLIVVVALIGFGAVYFFGGKGSGTAAESVTVSDAMKAAEGVAKAQNEMTSETEAMLKDEGTMAKESSMSAQGYASSGAMKDEGAMSAEGGSALGGMQKGSYETYASEKLAKANTGEVVLFFRASWCPTCRAVDADIRAHLGSIPADLVILDVNYDDSMALKQKYGVTYQHTFVQVKADGSLIKKWSGSPTLAALVAEVQ
jgi:thiol-disulfide isomerase/thioredoxin